MTEFNSFFIEKTLENICRDISTIKQDFITWQQIVDLIGKTTTSKIENFEQTLKFQIDKVNNKIDEQILKFSIELDESHIQIIQNKKLLDELQAKFYPNQQQQQKLENFAIGLMEKMEEYKEKIIIITEEQDLLLQKLHSKKEQGAQIFLEQLQSVVDEFYKKLNIQNDKQEKSIYEIKTVTKQLLEKQNFLQKILNDQIADQQKSNSEMNQEIHVQGLNVNSLKMQVDNAKSEITQIKHSLQANLQHFDSFTNKMNEFKQNIDNKFSKEVNNIKAFQSFIQEDSEKLKETIKNHVDHQIIQLQLKREKIILNEDNLANCLQERMQNQIQLKKRIKSLPQDSYTPFIQQESGGLRLLHSRQVIKVQKVKDQKQIKTGNKQADYIMSKSFYKL